ncbi:class I SAM-dependent methyltransferase [Cellulomonas cellasea]|uniref:SAM-dependent methyltransferase n=1 Tax=Cellulomonas cellasea TaxID=43670 RepID=A0A7W4UK11_9CELL|nr:class I SAM-dependent methyltransferase [Cellulomonas cellasea]MBB2925573.1 SAM-dependent methyltransferase [Cellulomonas cellasea]
MESPADFYDGLAATYHVLFDDWWAAAQWHGGVVAALLAARGVLPPALLLDCTCGIGTQALPLSAMGYRVTGTDISAQAVARADSEARARRLPVRLEVADVRVVDRVVHERQFDAVISCDNALPHLLTDADLSLALRSIRRSLRDGGVFLASIRDYDALKAARPPGTPISMYGSPGRRYGSGQAWTWSPDGAYVDITLFVLREESPGPGWGVSAHSTTYRALRRAELTSALNAGGFASVEWLSPLDAGYYQPVVIAQ